MLYIIIFLLGPLSAILGGIGNVALNTVPVLTPKSDACETSTPPAAI